MKLPNFTTRGWITIALYPMVMAVMYGAVVITVLSIGHRPADLAPWALVGGIIAMVLIAFPVSWYLAPKLRLNPDGRRTRRH
ncbi:MAG: hypothetical protein V2I51_06865 [Anderseniella sp.]|jgi:hypothetical protein|nr:hypothetical protein [Anderseniella sp.]